MIELPRALFLDADQQFIELLCSELWAIAPECAVLKTSSISEARNALTVYRPHLFCLDWSLRSGENGAGTLLRLMSDIMAGDPGNYEYPLLVNWNWSAAHQQDWAEQGVIFKMENPWIVLSRDRRADISAAFRHWHGNRIQRKRLLRLSKGTLDLSRTSFLRVSDRPAKVEYWDSVAKALVVIDRSRTDTFQTIAQALVSPFDGLGAVAASKSLFVKANQRSCLVNLAHVQEISVDEQGERAFVVSGASDPPRLNITAAPALASALQAIRFLGLWPRISRLSVPGP